MATMSCSAVYGAVAVGSSVGVSVGISVGVGGIGVAVAVGVFDGNGVRLDVGDGGTKPVGDAVGESVADGGIVGGRVDETMVAVGVIERVGVGVVSPGARRMAIRPAQ